MQPVRANNHEDSSVHSNRVKTVIEANGDRMTDDEDADEEQDDEEDEEDEEMEDEDARAERRRCCGNGEKNAHDSHSVGHGAEDNE